EIVQCLVPADALPLPFSARPNATHRVENALGIVNLIERRRTLRAIPAAAPRMIRIAFELANVARFLIDVRNETARRLAVETRRRHEAVVAAALDPIIPPFRGRKCRHPLLHAAGVRRMKALFAHEIGGPCPARMNACPCNHRPASESAAAMMRKLAPPASAR